MIIFSYISPRFLTLYLIYFLYRIQREQDFLRTSLRESKKLQNLEKRRKGDAPQANGASTLNNSGFVNSAFDRDGGGKLYYIYYILFYYNITI